jgi:ParB-like chromosome segregation protein Spo0J
MAQKPKTKALKRPKDATAAESEWVPITRLTPNPRNARTHSPEQIEAIGESLERFGWVRPTLVDEDYMIIAGHGTVLGARSKGYEEAKVVKASNMTPDMIRAYLIADNQLALGAEWLDAILKEELTYLENKGIDASAIGFSDAEIDELFKPPTIPKTRQPRSDASHKCPECGFEWKASK